MQRKIWDNKTTTSQHSNDIMVMVQQHYSDTTTTIQQQFNEIMTILQWPSNVKLNVNTAVSKR